MKAYQRISYMLKLFNVWTTESRVFINSFKENVIAYFAGFHQFAKYQLILYWSRMLGVSEIKMIRTDATLSSKPEAE